MLRLIILLLCLHFFSEIGCQQLPIARHYTLRDGLSQMKTTCIELGPNGYIWIGTRNGLNRFDGKNIVSYFEKDGLLHNRIHDIGFTTDGLLIALTYHGLCLFDGSSFTNYPRPFLNAEYQIFVDANDRIWILTHDETVVFEKGNFFKKPQKVLSIKTDVSTHENIYVYANGLFKLDDDSLIVIDSNTFKTEIYGRFLSKHPNLIIDSDNHYCFVDNGQVKCSATIQEFLKKTASENVFFEYHDDGVSIHASQVTYNYTQSPFLRIVDATLDHLGNIWIADENGFTGLLSSHFRHIDYLEVPYVWAMNQDTASEYFTASFGYGIHRSSNGQNFKRDPEGEKVAGTPYFLATSTADRFGRIYFGHASGLLRWDGEAYHNFSLRTPIYASAYSQSNDQLVIGGLIGVATLDMNGQIRDTITVSSGLHENEYIQNVSLDQYDNIWAGSYSGLSKIDNESFEIKNFIHEDGSLPSNGVFCSAPDSLNDVIWLGGDDGLLYYSFKLDSIIEVRSVVMNDIVKSLFLLNDSTLLIGSKRGLYTLNTKVFFSKDQSNFRVINESVGYEGLEPGFTGFFQDEDQDIWIPSASSIDKLSPSLFQSIEEDLVPRIRKINDQKIAFDPDKYDDHVIENGTVAKIEVDAIGMVRPDLVKLQYRLDGSAPSEWLSSTNIILEDLGHGPHSVEVRVGPTDLPFDQSLTDRIDFRVYLPFYKRQWFTIFGSALIILLISLSLMLYWLQRRENRRYAEQLKAAKYFRSQLLLSELNPHFIFNILSSIQHKVLLGDRNLAAKYVVKLSKMIRNFLNASHLSHRQTDQYRENNISLEEELELLNSYLEFEKLKSDDHFEYTIEVASDIFPSQCFLPPMLVQPYIENAIKHGLLTSKDKGLLKITFDQTEDALQVIIEDNGIGREAASQLPKREGHVSLGTLIIDNRIKLLNEMGYEMEIQTEDVFPHGTRVIIKITED